MVDTPCEVYCDYELKGDAVPQSIFKIELRKGTYILEFKQNGNVLYSQEYIMQSNDEEDFLRIDLAEYSQRIDREQKYKIIESSDVAFMQYGENKWIENKETGQEIPIDYKVSSDLHGFDKCGLLNVNVGGKERYEWADGPGYDTFLVIDGGKWGCINKLGEIQIPIIYDSLVFFNCPDVAATVLDSKVTFINKWNEIVFENTYDECEIVEAFVNKLCIVSKDGKKGIINEKGLVVLPLQYVDIVRFKSVFAIEKDGKWGLINTQCVAITPVMYDSLHYDYSNYEGTESFFVVEIGSKMGVINNYGKTIVPINYEEVTHKWNSVYFVKSKGLYGFYNEGELKTDIIYDSISRMNHGEKILVSLYNMMGVLDECGNVFIPTEYDNIECDGYGDDDIYIVEKNGEKGVFCNDKQIISTVYDTIDFDYWVLHGFILSKSNKKGFSNIDGLITIPVEYDNIQKIKRGYLLLSKDIKNGVYTEKGDCILEIKYDDIIAGESYFIVACNKKFGLYNYIGMEILPIEYDSIRGLTTTLILAYNNGWWQIYDVNNRDFLHAMFNEYSKGWGSQLIVQFGNTKNLYDYSKEDYLLYDFDDICESWTGCCYIVTENGKKGLYNDNGKILYDVIYDDIDVREEIIVAILNGDVVLYDYDGNILLDKHYQIIPEIANGIEWWGKGVHVEGRDSLFLTDPIIVKRKGKWGVINKDFRKIEEKQDIPLIKEYIPCEYDKIAYSDKEILTESNLDKDEIIRYFVKEEANGDLHFYEYQLENDIASIVNEWIEPKNKTYYLFFDTETTGTPLNYKAPSSDTRNWPRLVQLGWILMTENGEKISKGNYIIKPDGFTIPAEATKIHRITTKMALELGYDLSYVIDKFLQDFNKAKYIVGHNIDFDKKIIGAELIRLSKPDIMNSKQAFCTMKSSTDFCKIPGYYGYKYPKLQELYHKLFGRDYEDAHDAASDIEATQQCFWELRKKGLI